ncbi:MAG: polyprenol monophosphomannose synthase [Candidatus Aminicenantes bacterium]|nr:polyprenol monophosphomannose synthase [Candidatus Aminicenantes bacterium]
MKISVVLPTYNERESVLPVIEAIERSLEGRDHEVIVVDDNSPDGTWKIVAALARGNPKIKLIHRTRERGLTSAFNRGVAESRGEIISWLDCDLTLPPEKLPVMLKEIENGFDVVIGSRYIPGAGDARKERMAVLGSRIINAFARLVLTRSITDFTTGFVMSRKTVWDRIKFRGDYGEYCIDYLYRAWRSGYKIQEIPFWLTSRKFGETKTAGNLVNYLRRGRKYVSIIFTSRFHPRP